MKTKALTGTVEEFLQSYEKAGLKPMLEGANIPFTKENWDKLQQTASLHISQYLIDRQNKLKKK